MWLHAYIRAASTKTNLPGKIIVKKKTHTQIHPPTCALQAWLILFRAKRPQRAERIRPGTKQVGLTGWTGQTKYHQMLSNSWSALNQTRVHSYTEPRLSHVWLHSHLRNTRRPAFFLCFKTPDAYSVSIRADPRSAISAILAPRGLHLRLNPGRSWNHQIRTTCQQLHVTWRKDLLLQHDDEEGHKGETEHHLIDHPTPGKFPSLHGHKVGSSIPQWGEGHVRRICVCFLTISVSETWFYFQLLSHWLLQCVFTCTVGAWDKLS